MPKTMKLVKLTEHGKTQEVTLHFADSAKSLDVRMTGQRFIEAAPKLAMLAHGMMHRAKSGGRDEWENLAICIPDQVKVDVDRMVSPPQVLLICDPGQTTQLCLGLSSKEARKVAGLLIESAAIADRPPAESSGTSH